MKNFQSCTRFFQLTLSAALFLTSCASNHDDKLVGQNELPPIVARPETGIIPDTVYVYDLVRSYPQSSWKDFDFYYKNTLPKYHTGQAYTENLKKFVIFQMVSTAHFTEKADPASIEAYTQEQLAFSFPDTDILIQCLKGLDGYWDDLKIKATATESYTHTVDYIKKHMKNPDALLEKYADKFNRLRDFGQGIAQN